MSRYSRTAPLISPPVHAIANACLGAVLPHLLVEHLRTQRRSVHEHSDRSAQRFTRTLHNGQPCTEHLDQRDLRRLNGR